MTAARIAQLIIDHERRRERMRKGELEPTPIEEKALATRVERDGGWQTQPSLGASRDKPGETGPLENSTADLAAPAPTMPTPPASSANNQEQDGGIRAAPGVD